MHFTGKKIVHKKFEALLKGAFIYNAII